MSAAYARVLRVAGAFGLVVLAGLSVGCGRSYRVIHRGDVHFERCYGSDFDERIPAEYKLGCWAMWLRHYTFGQPLHRIQYAQGRVAAITAGLPGPHLPQAPVLTIVAPVYASDGPDPATTGDGGAVAPEAAAPDGGTTTTVEIAIPPRADSAAAARAATQPTDAPPTSEGPPESQCDAVCRSDWNRCVPACSQPETRSGCLTDCDDELRQCARTCHR